MGVETVVTVASVVATIMFILLIITIGIPVVTILHGIVKYLCNCFNGEEDNRW